MCITARHSLFNEIIGMSTLDESLCIYYICNLAAAVFTAIFIKHNKIFKSIGINIGTSEIRISILLTHL